jgi:hypothetical protein
MTNQSKPTFRLPGGAPPPPPAPPAPTAPLAAPAAAILAAFPLPWCVGPFGDIWVAADVEIVDPDVVGPRGVVDGKWRATGDKARMVMEHPAGEGIAALIVHAVNRLAGA